MGAADTGTPARFRVCLEKGARPPARHWTCPRSSQPELPNAEDERTGPSGPAATALLSLVVACYCFLINTGGGGAQRNLRAPPLSGLLEEEVSPGGPGASRGLHEPLAGGAWAQAPAVGPCCPSGAPPQKVRAPNPVPVPGARRGRVEGDGTPTAEQADGKWKNAAACVLGVIVENYTPGPLIHSPLLRPSCSSTNHSRRDSYVLYTLTAVLLWGGPRIPSLGVRALLARALNSQEVVVLAGTGGGVGWGGGRGVLLAVQGRDGGNASRVRDGISISPSVLL